MDSNNIYTFSRTPHKRIIIHTLFTPYTYAHNSHLHIERPIGYNLHSKRVGFHLWYRHIAKKRRAHWNSPFFKPQEHTLAHHFPRFTHRKIVTSTDLSISEYTHHTHNTHKKENDVRDRDRERDEHSLSERERSSRRKRKMRERNKASACSRYCSDDHSS